MSEWTIKRLYDSGIRVSPSRRFTPSSGSRDLRKIIPYVGAHMALFQFESMGVTTEFLHQINLNFLGLEVTYDQRDIGTHLVVLDVTGRKVFIEKPDFYRTRCLVRCSCPDFYFTYGYWNYSQGALFGPRPRPYVRKSNRGPRNPGHYPGLCKHLINCGLLMQTKEWTSNKGGRL